MNQIDWTPVVNVVIPGAAGVIAILLTWLTAKLAAILNVKRDEAQAALEAGMRDELTGILMTYLRHAIATGDPSPAATAAAKAAENVPDLLNRLKATPAQIETKAGGLIPEAMKIL